MTMKRRAFLKAGPMTGLALTALTIRPGRLLAGRPPQRGNGFPLSEATIAELQSMMERGERTSRELTELYLRRISEVDQSGPRLNSIIELNPDALSIAEKMDRERGEGHVRGPLHGIPVLVKDNIDTGDRMQTTAGSLALEGNIAGRDAFIVGRLREAGAVLLGKTNLSEWANFRSTSSSSGWSSRGGQTRNPYFLDRSPSGSSSGSGAAVSANLCTVAVGTETDGSVTSPASSNGIVGIKPTVGLLSRSGIIPISSIQDTAGPMARTVTDAAILLSVLAGVDERDPVTVESRGKAQADYTRFLDADGLKGKRIGIEKKPRSANRYIEALFQRALEVLKARGATIVTVSFMEELGDLGEAEYKVLQFEFKETLNRYLSGTKGPTRSLSDLIAFNSNDPDRMMPYFGQDILEISDSREGLDSDEYRDMLRQSHQGSRDILDRVLGDERLDALCGITAGPPCSIDLIYGDQWGDVSFTSPAAMAGYPHISLPCGQVHGLPVGLSFFAGPYAEPSIISIAYGYEQASRMRRPPEFRALFGAENG